MIKNLDDTQVLRQDLVDNIIFDTINTLNPRQKTLAWDIEMIASVRETIKYWLVDVCSECSEMDFYPYLRE